MLPGHGMSGRARLGLLVSTCVLAGLRLAGAEDIPGAAPEPSPARPRRWEVHADTGLQYDSNVTLDPSGQPIPGDSGDPADGAITVGAGGSVDVIDSDRFQVGVEYDLYQSLHFRLQDYDLRSNRVQATGGLLLLPQLWAGAQVGFEHYALGGDAYSREPFVTPFLSLTEGAWGLTQLLYRHGETTYLQEPFEGLRDGPTDVATLSQTVYWGSRYATAGYEFASERPTESTGSVQAACVRTVSADPGSALCPGDYRFRHNQGFVGVGFTPGWRTSVDVTYVLRWERYTEPNSLTDFRFKRRDTVNQVYVAVQRPLTTHLSAGVTYYGTFDNSNIDFYQYRRHIVSAEIRFSY